MKRSTLLGLLCAIGIGVCSMGESHAQKMDNQTLGEIIEAIGDSIEGDDGLWQFQLHGRLMVVITDENHNRMRIISPIVEVDELEESLLKNALIANFHTALDVKYAISEEILWSVFLHPLQELTHQQAEDALIQVYRAADSFGTTYSSTDLVFPGGGEEPEETPKEKKKKTSKI